MSGARYLIPEPVNEPAFNYQPGSPERALIQAEIKRARGELVELPMLINGKQVTSSSKADIYCPHDLGHKLGSYFIGAAEEVEYAIKSAVKAQKDWMYMPWEDRAAIFLRAADLLAGPYRAKINAATMLGQSKNVYQAEIDSACELIDFFRYNVKYMEKIYTMQPHSVRGIWNRSEWRPLEGFVFALTPFNFTAIAGNLPTAPAMLGNTVVWKPSRNQVYSASVIMEVLLEAGLPHGVINLIFSSGEITAKICLNHPLFAGIHFTGSTKVFNNVWKTVGENISKYRTYPRIVGETGGKDFVMVHPSAHVNSVATALLRGAFEYQGQKCSAASRAYIPASLWPELRDKLEAELKSFKMGGVEDFTNFINAVIDETSFDKLVKVIEMVKSSKDAEILFGGGYSKKIGYFIDPTVVVVKDPKFYTMEEELFGPILSVYIYPDNEFEETLRLVDQTSIYGLTGSIFSRDRVAIEKAEKALKYAAGNFYINDKPTGAVVGQQPFGGSRGSGTNDKAGSLLNLLRWVSPQSIKENLVPPVDYRYPFLEE